MSPEQEFRSPLLVLGGAKSGKSAYAEALMESLAPPYIYVATAQALDAEMGERVEAHKARRGRNWETIECPFELPGLLNEMKGRGRPVLVDCITLWLSNLLCFSRFDPAAAIESLRQSVETADYPFVIVSNEVGGGIVPDNELSRRFRDLAGSTNQMLARTCASVTLVVAGLPLRLK
jgi:adenosylcobinamide kinase/adenosylcobinamide-phosphate guanylyltransferase